MPTSETRSVPAPVLERPLSGNPLGQVVEGGIDLSYDVDSEDMSDDMEEEELDENSEEYKAAVKEGKYCFFAYCCPKG